MAPRRVYGIIAGALVGGGPFWLLGSVAKGHWPGLSALAVAVALSAAAFRTPGAWALGLLVGTAVSWGALALIVGSDWRLLPYVVSGFPTYYVAAAAAITVAWLIGSRRSAKRRAASS